MMIKRGFGIKEVAEFDGQMIEVHLKLWEQAAFETDE